MTRNFIAYMLAVVATYLLGAALISQFNIARIADMGFLVSSAQRGSAVYHDVIGMLGTYLPLIAVALIIAFLFTSCVLQRFTRSQTLLFVVAGFVGIVTLHLVMAAVFGITGVAPTRTLLGLLVQGCVGAVGGYVYVVLKRS